MYNVCNYIYIYISFWKGYIQYIHLTQTARTNITIITIYNKTFYFYTVLSEIFTKNLKYFTKIIWIQNTYFSLNVCRIKQFCITFFEFSVFRQWFTASVPSLHIQWHVFNCKSERERNCLWLNANSKYLLWGFFSLVLKFVFWENLHCFHLIGYMYMSCHIILKMTSSSLLYLLQNNLSTYHPINTYIILHSMLSFGM